MACFFFICHALSFELNLSFDRTCPLSFSERVLKIGSWIKICPKVLRFQKLVFLEQPARSNLSFPPLSVTAP